LPVRVLSRLFRRLFVAGLADAHAAGRLAFFGELDGLRNRNGVCRLSRAAQEEELVRLRQAALRRARGGLAYLARYTHRVAISAVALSGERPMKAANVRTLRT
jgi:hypothetical protein